MADVDGLKSQIKALAAEAGFARVGIAPAGPVQPEYVRRYERFIQAGRHAGMSYLARNLPERFAPARLVEGARSVICLAVGYAPGARSNDRLARYARGRDYHVVLRDRCRCLMDEIRRLAGDFGGRGFVDSGPVPERTLAARAGLGWIGRNGCLIVSGLGSYVVLCEVLCNLPLPADEPMAFSCGDCRACVQACPTGACLGDGLVDARKCLSYMTVECRGPIDRRYRSAAAGRLFGCDSCQEACPHNRDVPVGDAELTGELNRLAVAGLDEMLCWSEDQWADACRGTAAERAGPAGLVRNAIIAAGNSGDASLVASLARLKAGWPQWSELVDWAAGRLGGADQV